MVFSFYEICWFFFIYSFLGWCGEVCLAASYRKKFVNRGVVNSPLCPIYGTGAVAFTIFLPELAGDIFFLFLGGMILASFIEFTTGALLEKLSAVIETVLNVLDEVPKLFGGFLDFLGILFPFLPSEITLLLTFGVVAVVFAAIIKAIRS